MKRLTTLAIALTAVTLGPASPASADDAGADGRVVALQLNGAGSDDYASFQGRLTIRDTKGKRDVYLWGGSACPGQKLTDTQVEVLAAAMRARTTVRPLFKVAEGSAQRCLVGFELRT